MAKQATQPTRIAPASQRRSDDAFQQVVARIFEGRLAPGTRLPSERDLSGLLRVSRATLRDALNQLETRGYIERRPKSGNFVCTAIPPSLQEPIKEAVDSHLASLSETIEIRKVLEAWAVEKAAESPTPKSLRALRECLEAMRAATRSRADGQFDRHREADVKFHQIVADMAGNSIYVHLIDFLARLISRSVAISKELMAEDFTAQNLQAHQRVYEALAARDPVKARQAMLEHFEFVEKRLGSRRRGTV